MIFLITSEMNSLKKIWLCIWFHKYSGRNILAIHLWLWRLVTGRHLKGHWLPLGLIPPLWLYMCDVRRLRWGLIWILCNMHHRCPSCVLPRHMHSSQWVTHNRWLVAQPLQVAHTGWWGRGLIEQTEWGAGSNHLSDLHTTTPHQGSGSASALCSQKW